LGSHPLWRYQERGFWSGEAPEKGFWGMQFDVSGFAEMRLTFACQNGSQNRVWREKYFQKNSPTVSKGGNRDSGLGIRATAEQH
jgi:hypothetical protein